MRTLRGGRRTRREGVRCTSAHLTSSEPQSAGRELEIIASNIRDDALGVLAADEDVERGAEREVERQRALAERFVVVPYSATAFAVERLVNPGRSKRES
jgi:hypothetical protein